MPLLENKGARIYWDEQGAGDPILLIMGLGFTAHMWERMRPDLSRHYRTVALDNRGAGRSDVPPGPYPIPLMAPTLSPCWTLPAWSAHTSSASRWAA